MHSLHHDFCQIFPKHYKKKKSLTSLASTKPQIISVTVVTVLISVSGSCAFGSKSNVFVNAMLIWSIYYLITLTECTALLVAKGRVTSKTLS